MLEQGRSPSTGPVEETSRLTHGQLQIWVGQRRHPQSPLYNMAFAFVFDGEIRSDVFLDAWQSVVADSDALRTRVVERNGTPHRQLRPAEDCGTQTVDLSDAPDPEVAFRRWCEERCARPLVLHGSLVDSVLVRLGGGRTGWYLNLHHLVTDAWSTVLLYREVAAAYEARLGGEASAETPQSELFPYYDTAQELVRELSTGSEDPAGTAAERHWTERRSTAGGGFTLYGRDPRPAETASRRTTLELDEARSRALERLAGTPGFRSFSPAMSRFAVLATLLLSWRHRASGQHQLGFDAPVAGRPTPRSKRSIGLFIEMFPFRCAVEPGDTFRDLGGRCLAEAQQFLRHALPGTSAPTGASSSPVVLNYFPDSFGDFAGLSPIVEWVHPGHGDSVHALRLQVHDFSGTGRTMLHFDWNEEALPFSLAPRALAHFERLLDALIEDPDGSIAEVDLLTEEEREIRRALVDSEGIPLPRRSVVGLFEERADAEPNVVALRQGAVEVRYGELQGRVRSLAIALRRRGLRVEEPVAILSRRSISTVTAILGVLEAGGAWVPIDPGQPRRRMEQILADCGARLLLLPPGELPEIDESSVDLLRIDAEVDEGLASGEAAVAGTTSPPTLDRLAYMIYTSGSSGPPKGVLVEHGGLVDYLLWAERTYVRGDRLSFALFTSLSFDLTITSLFLPLLSGGELVIYPESGGAIDSAVLDVANDDAVDFVKLTPSHLSLLRRFDLGQTRLRRMVVGGEDFQVQLARSISSQTGDRIEIYNEYGPTEAIVGCTVHRYDPATDTLEASPSVPIGRPAAHVELDVLNEAGVPVPVGVPGELWISRYGLARGYHGNEELTAERFPPHPCRPDSRRYRSGDLVRLDENGVLHYLGRIDRQLKISGRRVEPGEIEATLASHPAVEQCVVIARGPIEDRESSFGEIDYCVRCGLPSNYPRALFDEQGVCNVCHAYDTVRERAEAYFRTEQELVELFARSRAAHPEAPYDCMMLLSGGKDSTYALARLVDMGLSVFAFTLDNGYISEGAKENMRRVTDQLGVPLELGTTPAMRDIFRDSLERFSNVCHGCFKTIYTLSTNRAHELGIPIVVTGLSRGQMFETRLTEELFRDGRFTAEDVDAAVLAARKVYHRVHDEVFRSLDVSRFQDDRIFDEVRYVDFYRYCDVGLDEVLGYLREKLPWVRPEDTGRSSNCLINDTGIFVHKRERRFHNYALPYSWDVRLGHKTREQALAELHDEIDEERVRRTLLEIGYEIDAGVDPRRSTTLEAFWVRTPGVEEPPSEGELRSWLEERLPSALVPATLREIDAIPLTPNGKLDERALPRSSAGASVETRVAPRGPVEEFLVEVWREELGIDDLGAQSHFFELGGTSLGAMDVMVRLCREFDIELELETLFEHPTVRELAHLAEERILADVAGMTVAEQRELLGE